MSTTTSTAAAAAAAAAAATVGGGGGGGGDTGVVAVYVTVPDATVGEKLSGLLVESKLAACVNIVPGITSVYWWDGKVNKDPELLLIIKSRIELLPELTDFVKRNHPYDECEVIALPVVGGSPSYLQWVMSSTHEPGQGGHSSA